MTTKHEPSRPLRKKASGAKPGSAGARTETGGGTKRAKAKRGAADRSKPGRSAAAKAAEEFVRGVLVRGEAAKAGRRGKLPPGATHEIVSEAETGLPKLRRRRFSLA